MRRSNATTLQDVARDAGVATITVSVVLNGSRSGTRVSETTRARIVEAANRLNYRPNGVARALSRNRMDNIGVVGIIERNSVNLYFLDVLTGILSAAAGHNQNTTILSITGKDDENRILQFCDGRIDGIILVAPVRLTDEFAERLLRYTPYVMVHGNEAPSNTDDLDVDNEGGAFAATKYLIDLGHRRIAHFGGPMEFEGPRLRLAGYRRALESAGIPYDDNLVLPGDFLAGTGAARTRSLLTDFDKVNRPTAIFCVNDVVACSCLEVLAENGVKVPAEMSVVGFDDGAIARMVTPQLTTIRQPLHEMGQFAVDRLMFRINESLSRTRGTSLSDRQTNSEASNQPLAEPHIQIFPFELIVRASTAPPMRDTR